MEFMWECGTNQYPYYNDAVSYFIHGNRDSDNLIHQAIVDLGDDVYIELSELMLEYERNHEYYKEDIEERIREIIDDND